MNNVPPLCPNCQKPMSLYRSTDNGSKSWFCPCRPDGTWKNLHTVTDKEVSVEH